MIGAQVHYGDSVIQYRVCHTPNRVGKLAIHVHPNGIVQVDAPNGAEVDEIKKAVLKRARWIVKHLAEIEEQEKHVLKREYVSGETHFYLGRRYQLKVLTRKNEYVKLLAGRLEIGTCDRSPEHVSQLLHEWYVNRCHDVFKRRLNEVAAGLPWVKGKGRTFKVTPMQKQWGSCSPKGLISLNPHLVKAPRDCIDYVLLHELAHIKEHNHSKRFYSLLSRYMADWESRKAKLDGMAGLLINC